MVLRRAGKDLPDRPAEAQLLFANGDCVPLHDCKLEGEKVHYQIGNKERMAQQTPLSSLSVIWLTPPGDPEERAKLRRRWTTEKRARDVIRLRNGDTVEGILTGMDASAVQIDADGKKAAIELDKIAAVTLSTELALLPKPKTAFGRVILANGSRLSLAKAECSDGQR